MKTLKLTCLATLLTLAGLTSTTDAVAAPTTSRAAKKRTIRPGAHKKTMFKTKADLRCSIQAFEDAQGMKPIANGRQLGYGGGSPKVYVRVVVENAGRVAAANFKNSVSIQRNGSSVFSTNDTLTLPPGLAKIYPLVTVNLPGTTNNLKAAIKADNLGGVSESNEYNNTCRWGATVSIVH